MTTDTKTLQKMYFAFLTAALDSVHPDKGKTWDALGYHQDSFTEDARSAVWRECRTFMKLAERQGYPVTLENADIIGVKFWLSRTEPDPVFNKSVLRPYSPEAADYYDELTLCFGNIAVACDENDDLNLD